MSDAGEPDPPQQPQPSDAAPKDSSMEIHKPHAAKTWKEFFIELGTIVIGILIAIGLEQTIAHYTVQCGFAAYYTNTVTVEADSLDETVYSISIATFGGTTQLVVTWLIYVAGSPMAPAWYAIGAAAIGQIALMLMPESAPVRWKAMPAVVAIAATPA